MGSFNVACSISNISINSSDPVAYIPLENARYRYHIGDGNDMLLHTYCFYVPVTLPIFGIYNDYGGVNDIEENKNTKIIEEHFCMPIDKVMDRKRDGAVGTISSGMFIHRKIYDVIVNKCSQIDEWGNTSSPIFGPHSHDPMKSLTAKLEEYLKEIEKSTELNERLNKLLPEHARVDNLLLNSICNIFAFREYGVFNDIYQSKIQQGELKDEIIEFMLFECGMGATNNFYFPTMNGYQCGNHWVSKILYWEAFKIVVSNTLRQKYDWLEPKRLWWTIKYEVKRRWKRIKDYVSTAK